MQNDNSSEITVSHKFISLCRWCAYLSGVTCIFGIVFIVIFYIFYLTTGKGYGFGELNDTAVIIQYTLMLPLTIAFYKIFRRFGAKLSMFSMLVGICGILSVIILQILLITGVIPFARQIGMVAIAFMIVVVWFILNRILGRSTAILPESFFLNIMAGLYFGYPSWALKVARRLKAV